MINCIVAVEKNHGIGFEGSMPWPHLKYDMKWFKQLTMGHIIIMGSTTWSGLGQSLPGRVNIVLSRNHSCAGADHVFSDTDTALDFCEIEYPDLEIFIIGGQAIYEQYMGVIDTFYVTEIDADYACDKFFNLDYVRKSCRKTVVHETHTDTINYKMVEYSY